jgi:hypothetical protein
MDRQLARRQFLGFLAGSPVLATPAVTSVITSLLACASDQAFAQSYDALRKDRFWTTGNLEFEHEQDTQWCIFRNRRHSMHAVGT